MAQTFLWYEKEIPDRFRILAPISCAAAIIPGKEEVRRVVSNRGTSSSPVNVRLLRPCPTFPNYSTPGVSLMSSRLMLRVLLGAMMFFQYAVWGAWTPILGATIASRLHATGAEIGAVYGVLWLACIITPFIGGQIVDRLMPSQWYLAISAIVCAGSAWMMSSQHEIGSLLPFHNGLIPWMWVWALAFAPTIGIANSIVMYHLGKEPDEVPGAAAAYQSPYVAALGIWLLATVALIGFVIWKGVSGAAWSQTEIMAATIGGALVVAGANIPLVLFDLKTGKRDDERTFSVIRTAGTTGWIAASLLLTLYLFIKPTAPGAEGAPIEEMQIAAIFGVILTVVAFLLPNTPPSKVAKDPWAFTKSFKMFATVRGFTIFMIVSFLISTEFQFYYVFSGPFMENGMGIKHELVSLYKSIAQYAEIICLGLFTPLSLKYLGMRKTLVLGALAWPLRYFIFALYKFVPVPIVLASMSFHGIGFAFVFVTSYIYIDRISPRDIRASAQSLFTLVTLGVGNWMGTYFSGMLKDHFTTMIPDPAHAGQTIPGPVNWQMVFIVPAALTTLCGIIYWLTFREPKPEPVVETTPIPVEA